MAEQKNKVKFSQSTTEPEAEVEEPVVETPEVVEEPPKKTKKVKKVKKTKKVKVIGGSTIFFGEVYHRTVLSFLSDLPSEFPSLIKRQSVPRCFPYPAARLRPRRR